MMWCLPLIRGFARLAPRRGVDFCPGNEPGGREGTPSVGGLLGGGLGLARWLALAPRGWGWPIRVASPGEVPSAEGHAVMLSIGAGGQRGGVVPSAGWCLGSGSTMAPRHGGRVHLAVWPVGVRLPLPNVGHGPDAHLRHSGRVGAPWFRWHVASRRRSLHCRHG